MGECYDHRQVGRGVQQRCVLPDNKLLFVVDRVGATEETWSSVKCLQLKSWSRSLLLLLVVVVTSWWMLAPTRTVSLSPSLKRGSGRWGNGWRSMEKLSTARVLGNINTILKQAINRHSRKYQNDTTNAYVWYTSKLTEENGKVC